MGLGLLLLLLLQWPEIFIVMGSASFPPKRGQEATTVFFLLHNTGKEYIYTLNICTIFAKGAGH